LGAETLILLQFFLATLSAFVPPGGAAGEAAGGLQIDPDLPARERTALRDSFERVLPMACEPPPCVSDCTEDQPSVALVIDGDSRDYTLHWTANDPRLDEPLIVESRCELCSLVEVEEQLAADLGRVCAQLTASTDALGRLRVSSQPEAAWLRIDGRRIGRTPWAGELDMGEHRLEVGSRGHGSQARTVDIFSGVERHETFELMPLQHRARPSWPGWVSMGFGFALGIAGTALLAIDGKEWPGRCSGSNIDATGNCRFVYRTRSLGIAFASIGAVSLTAGVGLMVWSQHGDRGAGLAWRRSF
jgi:hypothetical protein